MQLQRRRTLLTVLGLSIGIFSLLFSSIRAQEGNQATEKFLNNVVQLTVTFNNGEIKHGFGFVVGEQEEEDMLYVVTAKHVVRKDEPDVRTTSIKARFCSDRGKPRDTEPLDLSYGTLDLALLEIPKPSRSYTWETRYFSSPKQDTQVWFIGRNQDWWVPADIEAGIIKDPPILSEFLVRIRSVLPGTSGAPLITKEGIVGMIIEDSQEHVIALDIETIRHVVSARWGYPWGLQMRQSISPSQILTDKQVEKMLEKLNNNQKLVDRLLQTLDEKDVAIENLEKEIEQWIEKYQELEGRLAKRSTGNPLIVQAKERLAVGELEEVEKFLQQSLEQHLQTFEEERKAAASDAFELGSLKELQLDYQQARKYYEQAVYLDAQNGMYYNVLGRICYVLGEYKKAISSYKQALAIDRQVYGDKHPPVSVILINLGVAWQALGEYEQAIELYEQALAIDRQVYGDKKRYLMSVILNNLGGAWQELGDYHKAIVYYEHALAIKQQVHGDDYLQIAITLNNLGGAWQELGDHHKAIVYCEQALAIDRQVYGDKHPKIATYLNNLGAAWQELGYYQKAIVYYEHALAIEQQVYGGEHPRVAVGLNNLGEAWRELGEYYQAIEYYERALAINKKVYGEGRSSDIVYMLNNLGKAWRELGDCQKAVKLHKQALAIAKQFYGEKHPKVATVLNSLGEAWRELGDCQKAVELHKQALAMDRQVYGDKHPDVGRDLNNLGRAWQALGEYQQALELYEQALTIFVEKLGDEHSYTKIVRENITRTKENM